LFCQGVKHTRKIAGAFKTAQGARKRKKGAFMNVNGLLASKIRSKTQAFIKKKETWTLTFLIPALWVSITMFVAGVILCALVLILLCFGKLVPMGVIDFVVSVGWVLIVLPVYFIALCWVVFVGAWVFKILNSERLWRYEDRIKAGKNKMYASIRGYFGLALLFAVAIWWIITTCLSFLNENF